MAAFIFRCPTTGYKVQGFVADDPAGDDAADDASYESITCIVCMRVHLVNPKTGKTIED